MARKTAARARKQEGDSAKGDAGRSWLVLLPQLATRQGTVRVRLWRRLQQLGALALKNGAHVLPDTPQQLEDAEWVVRELRDAGGEATLLRARFLEGGEDDQLVQEFREVRNAEYAALVADAKRVGAKPARKRLPVSPDESGKLRRRLEQIDARDYFGAAGRDAAANAVDALERKAVKPHPAPPGTAPATSLPKSGTVWVTRAGVQVDRMASAWLIRRWLDPKARFKFVRDRRYAPKRGEVRYDMLNAEFTHADGCCTFEILLRAARLSDSALYRLGEIIHELDLRDGRYQAPETPGVAAALAGVVAATTDDLERIGHASVVLDGLHAALRGTRARPRR